MVTVFLQASVQGGWIRCFTAEQHHPSSLMNLRLQSTTTACKDDQVSGTCVVTVIFLYMVNFPKPFPTSCC